MFGPAAPTELLAICRLLPCVNLIDEFLFQVDPICFLSWKNSLEFHLIDGILFPVVLLV